jgi:HAD superfamily phosphoserine phosphatase-like hydrolase
MSIRTRALPRRYLVASDFDQTLSFNDSGVVLSDLIGAERFESKVAGLSRASFVQQGAELAYLLLHDPEFRQVRKEHLVEVGRRIRLKHHIDVLTRILANGIDGLDCVYNVISAAPEEVIQSALEGIVPPDRIHGTRFDYDPDTGEIRGIARVPAGYGKVAVLGELQRTLGIPRDRVVYIGDGSSDVHVMLHVDNRDGFTIAVSENQMLARIAQRTVLSDSAFSVLIPILERIVGWRSAEIREFFESNALRLEDWERARTDRVRIVA